MRRYWTVLGGLFPSLSRFQKGAGCFDGDVWKGWYPDQCKQNGRYGMPDLLYFLRSLVSRVLDKDDGGGAIIYVMSTGTGGSTICSLQQSWRWYCWRHTTRIRTVRVGPLSGWQPPLTPYFSVYRLSLHRSVGSVGYPVGGYKGRATTRVNLQVHLVHCHMRDMIFILE